MPGPQGFSTSPSASRSHRLVRRALHAVVAEGEEQRIVRTLLQRERGAFDRRGQNRIRPADRQRDGLSVAADEASRLRVHTRARRDRRQDHRRGADAAATFRDRESGNARRHVAQGPSEYTRPQGNAAACRGHWVGADAIC